MSEIIERAVVETSKLATAARSLANWFRYECNRLRIERRLFREELSKTDSPQQRAELLAALAENASEQKNLDEGWKNSSLRRRLDSGEKTEQPIAETVEHRLIVTPAGTAPPLKTKNSGVILKLNGLGAVYGKNPKTSVAFKKSLPTVPSTRCWLQNRTCDVCLITVRTYCWVELPAEP